MQFTLLESALICAIWTAITWVMYWTTGVAGIVLDAAKSAVKAVPVGFFAGLFGSLGIQILFIWLLPEIALAVWLIQLPVSFVRLWRLGRKMRA